MRSPGRAPPAREWPGCGRASPTSVTLITSGPSQVFVSPPAIATSYCSANGIIPSYSSWASSQSALARQGHAHDAASGRRGHGGQVAQIDRQRLAADARGVDLGEVEVDAVGQQVDRQHAVVPLCPSRTTAASSPGPSAQLRMGAATGERKPGDEFRFHARRS